MPPHKLIVLGPYIIDLAKVTYLDDRHDGEIRVYLDCGHKIPLRDDHAEAFRKAYYAYAGPPEVILQTQLNKPADLHPSPGTPAANIPLIDWDKVRNQIYDK